MKTRHNEVNIVLVLLLSNRTYWLTITPLGTVQFTNITADVCKSVLIFHMSLYKKTVKVFFLHPPLN